uniref:ATP-dependent RNA helicase n=1 Tax=Rhipicephalus zambeziensis TaxID=60191 RepID=A0A224YRT9_9ACAR
MALCCLLLEACVAAERGKVIVFLATQDSVDFEHALFSSVLGVMLEDTDKRIDFVRLHGEMTQHDRAEVFNRFREATSGVLFTTDVASRGIDVPQVDLIVQCCVPLRPEEYVHRAGRTARIGAKGKVVLLLFPSEVGFLDVLAQRNIQLDQMDLKGVLSKVFAIKSHILEARTDPGQKLKTMEDFVTALQLIFESEVYKETALQEMAKKGFLSHICSYASYPRAMRHVVSFKALHLGHLAKAYCLRETPSALGAQWAANLPQDAPGRRFGRSNTRFGPSDRRGKQHRPPVKRMKISEYDSGLVASKRKRKKHVPSD